ncbi:MAG TPA: cupin domain-containing protein [Actinomycetota bacterium]|nr:cupin domain-containing protein [Actinomycetota bacterium]
MAATRHAAGADETDALRAFADEGCSPARAWGNGPGDRYGRHEHPVHKVLFCLEGSLVFHTDDGDIELAAGDRLDLDPGTSHAATVGPDGCRCVEAWRR